MSIRHQQVSRQIDSMGSPAFLDLSWGMASSNEVVDRLYQELAEERAAIATERALREEVAEYDMT